MGDAVLVERELRDHVAHLTLNRPEALNALNVALRDELVDAWRWLRDDDDVRAAVLTGAGDRAFCVGSDLKDQRLDEFDYMADELFGNPPRTHFMRSMVSPKPVVCAINGYALGGGLELALACDIRIASSTAVLGLPEVGVGSMPGAGATQYLPRSIALSDAMYLLLTGQKISAEEAHRMRLVTECVEPGHLQERAHEIAAAIAGNAPLSVRATRLAAQAGLDLPLDQGLAYERHLWGLVRATQDRAEGRRAFREGRPPQYRGR